jgi:hypothetical protein
MYTRIETSFQPRIELTDQMIKNFLKNIFSGTVSELASSKGLSYTLVYNLVHGRIRSLSARDYRIIFGEEPQWKDAKRVDGELFRDMVKLWLFLNDEVTEADLYREFYQLKKEWKRLWRKNSWSKDLPAQKSEGGSMNWTRSTTQSGFFSRK